MRTAKIFINKNTLAGFLIELDAKSGYKIEYVHGYSGPPISLTMPTSKKVYEFAVFPPFFDGVLPEGSQLEALLRQAKLDRDDYFGQLVTVGKDLIGAVSVEEVRS
jgi:serine/threonine-protein kinase HipA